MDEVRIDHLALELSGISESQGRGLAMRITEGLAAADIPAGVAAAQGAIRVDLPAGPSGSLDALPERIVAEVLRQLRRSP
jgi:hypothetical protein